MTLLFLALAYPEPQRYKNQDIRNMAGRKIINYLEGAWRSNDFKDSLGLRDTGRMESLLYGVS